MFFLTPIVNVEDVVETTTSIMYMIDGCLHTCSLVSVSPTEVRNILRE